MKTTIEHFKEASQKNLTRYRNSNENNIACHQSKKTAWKRTNQSDLQLFLNEKTDQLKFL